MNEVIKALNIGAMIFFGLSVLIFTILTYMYALSPYTTEMFKCMARNSFSIGGLILTIINHLRWKDDRYRN